MITVEYRDEADFEQSLEGWFPATFGSEYRVTFIKRRRQVQVGNAKIWARPGQVYLVPVGFSRSGCLTDPSVLAAENFDHLEGNRYLSRNRVVCCQLKEDVLFKRLDGSGQAIKGLGEICSGSVLVRYANGLIDIISPEMFIILRSRVMLSV